MSRFIILITLSDNHYEALGTQRGIRALALEKMMADRESILSNQKQKVSSFPLKQDLEFDSTSQPLLCDIN